MTKLSIITINLNNVAGLQKTMKSVFAQTFTDYEYIIIDGGSTDGSREYIKKHTEKLASWVSEKDTGVYNAMNKGIVKAKGEYLLFLNSGDYFYLDDTIKNLDLETLEEDIVYGNLNVQDQDNGKSWIETYPDNLTFEFFLHKYLPHPASLIKKSLFEKNGLYNENQEVVSDWEFFMNNICLYGASYKYINSIVAVFFCNGVSANPANASKIKKEKEIILNRYYRAFLPDYTNADNCRNELRNLNNSRMHKIVSKILNLRFYKFIKSI